MSVQELGGLFKEGELAPAPEPITVEALAIWNEIAPGAGWPAARFLTQSRRTALRRAIKDYGGLLGWKTHLAVASRNDFLTGQVGRTDKHMNWRPDIDWFCKPSTVLKILEEKFPANGAGTRNGKANGGAGARDPLAEDRARLRNYRPGDKFWPAHYGPRPEEDGCRIAPEALATWREVNHVTVRAPESLKESREERYAATVAGYRRVGRWDDANRVEQALADLQGRAAVLVPAPDVAGYGMPERERPLSNPGRPSSVNNPARKRGGIVQDVVPDFDDIPESTDFGSE